MKARFQLWAGVLLLVGGASYPIAYAAWRFMHFSFAASFGASALVLLIVVVTVFAHFRNKDEETGRVMDSGAQFMNIEEAAAAAQAILSDSSRFAVVRRSAADYPHVDDLAYHIGRFFADIESIKATRGDAQVARSSISPSAMNPEYLRIGTDIESVEIAIRPGDESVYEFDAFDPDKPFDRHESIYHWVLAVDQELYGAD
ncbi:MAG TPA: hypothetical protein VGQ36_08435 [Thermoanaerobaculia bacterium]|jgi:hypothetical protein|nr:hypothetical protein [Thermoanaerobaculia bacterium]